MTDQWHLNMKEKNTHGWKVNQSRVNYFSLCEWDCIITSGRQDTRTRVTLAYGICHRALANDSSSHVMASVMIICTSHTFDSHEQNKRHLSTLSLFLSLPLPLSRSFFHLSLRWNKNDSYITRFSLSYRCILHAQYCELFMKSSDRKRESKKRHKNTREDRWTRHFALHRTCNTSPASQTNLKLYSLYRSEWWHLMAPMTWHGECLLPAICVFIGLQHDKVESAATQLQDVHIYSQSNCRKRGRSAQVLSLLPGWLEYTRFILFSLSLSPSLRGWTIQLTMQPLWSLFFHG